MKPWMIAVVVVVVLGVGGGAFYGGMKFRENQIMQDPSVLFQQMAGQRGTPGAFGQRGNGQAPGAVISGSQGQPGSATEVQFAGGTMGTIASIDGNVITLTTQDGSVKVQTSDTTLIEKYSSVAISDLQTGERIIVSGSKNDDGTITARSIQSMRGAPSIVESQSSTDSN